MKKFQPDVKWIALAAGAAAGILRYLPIAAGTDEKGLYNSAHPGWIGYLGLTVVMTALLWCLSRRQMPPSEQPHPKKLRPKLMVLTFVGLLLFVLAQLGDSTTVAIAGVDLPIVRLFAMVGLAAAGALACGAIAGFRGKPVPPLAYALPCLYFGLEMFRVNLAYGGEPEMIRFLPQALASIAATLAIYQLWGIAVGLPNAKRLCFWRALAVYLCLAAYTDHLMYACVALWLLFEEEPAEQPAEAAAEEPADEPAPPQTDA